MENLTTKEKVKALLNITSTSFDTVLDELIKGVSSFFYGEVDYDIKYEAGVTETKRGNFSKNLYLSKKLNVIEVTKVEKQNGGTLRTPTFEELDIETFIVDPETQNSILSDNIYDNSYYRITYNGGYLIDFTNETDPIKHNLPADIVKCCNDLVIQQYLKRKSQGISDEMFEGSKILWREDISDYAKNVLFKYAKKVIV